MTWPKNKLKVVIDDYAKRTETPELNLLCAVIERALLDVQLYHQTLSEKVVRKYYAGTLYHNYRSAVEFFLNEGHEPYSFKWILEHLEIDYKFAFEHVTKILNVKNDKFMPNAYIRDYQKTDETGLVIEQIILGIYELYPSLVDDNGYVLVFHIKKWKNKLSKNLLEAMVKHAFETTMLPYQHKERLFITSRLPKEQYRYLIEQL